MTESESGVLPLHYTSIFSWQSGFALLNNISTFGRGCQEKMRISQQKIRIGFWRSVLHNRRIFAILKQEIPAAVESLFLQRGQLFFHSREEHLVVFAV